MSTSETQIWQGLQELFNLVFRHPVQIRPDLSAKDVPEWDSMAQITLIIEMEKKFNIRFRLGEVENATNLQDLAQLISRHMDRATELL